MKRSAHRAAAAKSGKKCPVIGNHHRFTGGTHRPHRPQRAGFSHFLVWHGGCIASGVAAAPMAGTAHIP